MPVARRTRIWPSPITATSLVAGAAAPGEIRASAGELCWSESRPSEGGRVQVVRWTPDGSRTDVLPGDASARSRVHEYGGGAWALSGTTLAWVDDTRDGAVRWIDVRHRAVLGAAPGDGTTTVSPPAPPGGDPRGVRYADLQLDRAGGRVLAVRERHEPGGVVNDLVTLPLDGSAAADASAVGVLASGADHFASPCLDATGERLAFVRWFQPAMPWDATELVVADLATGTERVVAGGSQESVVEPQWAPDGSLTFCSDRTGWWNPYRWDPTAPDAPAQPLAPVDGEIGGPLWVFGNRSIAWLPDGRFACTCTAGGFDRLANADADGTPPRLLDVPFTHIPQVVPGPDGTVAVVAGTPQAESAPYLVTVGDDDNVEVAPLRPARDLHLGDAPQRWWSVPEAVAVPTGDGTPVAHALVYPPTNPTNAPDEAATPAPRLVLIHGGPTSAARVQLNLTVQFWTSRGFCVADVNYRGSTGYGRAYRDALHGAWGIADVEDCVAVARHLVAAGTVDAERLGIRGGSAGGFTTLAALCFHDTYTAGASAYGVADLELLARDTHKFEARYLDSLVGPWPEDAATYRARSPIHHLDRLDRPVAIFQGLQDAVVPPEQAEVIVAAVRDRDLPYAALTFESEGHGFRQAATLVRALEGELWFFAHAFDLVLDEPIDPVPGQGLAPQ
jgi:dipeptidyl aminopeptidase/acylaminoacyl peptidase